MPAKKPKPVDCTTCFYKCKDNLTEETGDQICKDYTTHQRRMTDKKTIF